MKKYLILVLTLLAFINAEGRLSGTYTIDPSQSASSTNYLSFTAAVSDLDSGKRSDGGTVNGPGVFNYVIINVASGTYNEQLHITTFYGPITFQSAVGDSSKVILTSTSTNISGPINSTVLLDWASFITFNKITISRTGLGKYQTVVEMRHYTHDDNFTHCRVIGVKQTNFNNNADLIYVGVNIGSDDRNSFINNSFKYGSSALYFVGTSGYPSQYNIFSNNVVDSTYGTSVFITWNDDITVEYNRIINAGYGDSSFSGIEIDSCSYGPQMIGNTVLMPYGGASGITYKEVYGTGGSPSIFVNNFVSLGTGRYKTPYGLVISGDQHYIYYNTVVVYKPNSGGCVLFTSGAKTMTSIDNIFYNAGGGPVLIVQPNGLTISKNNDLYTTGSTLVVFGSTNIKSLADWQSTSNGLDSNSLSFNPNLVSNSDYHTIDPLLYHKGVPKIWLGIPIDWFSTDIEGSKRNIVTPSLGAYEFPVYHNDAGVSEIVAPSTTFCSSKQNVSVNLVSNGLDTLRNVTINWSLNNKLQTAYKYNGKISPGSTITITLASNIFSAGSYVIKAWTSNPNSVSDSFPQNDTATVVDTVFALPVPYAGGKDTICRGIKFGLGQTAQSGHSYAWLSKPAGLSSTLSSPSVTPTTTTTYYLTETITNSGCSASDSTIITVNPLPVPDAGGNKSICSGNIAFLGKTAMLGQLYTWTSKPSGFTSVLSNPTINPSITTVYYLIQTDSITGCSALDSAIVTLSTSPLPNAGGNKSICEGNNITSGKTSISGDSYVWSSKPTGFTSTSSNPVERPISTITYFVTEVVDSTGCSATDSATILVSNPVSDFNFVDACQGDSTFFTNYSTSPSAFKWNFGDGDTSTLKDPQHLYASSGSYLAWLKITSSSGCSDSSSKTIVISPCVWPGDANNDKTVDMNDLLTLGIAYGTTGYPRPSASISWTGQPSPDWDSSFTNGVNYKHADCNGDSIIDYKDTIAISVNYGKSHSKSFVLNQGSPSDPQFVIKSMTDTVYAGDTLKASLTIGSSTNQVQNLYGFLLSLSADPTVFDTKNASIKIIPSFLGTENMDLMGLKILNPSSGLLDIGITRMGHKNATGNGSFAILYIPVKSTLSQKDIKSALSISGNIQISYNQKNIPLYFSSDSFVVQQGKSGINQLLKNPFSEVNIFPNPFQSSTTIQYTLSHKSTVQIVLYDITGKQAALIINQNLAPGSYKTEINGEKYNLLPGIYLLKLMTDDGYVSMHVVKF